MDADIARLIAVQQWLVREARLLDERRFDAWLALVDERIRYCVPARAYAAQGEPRDFSTWSVERELAPCAALPLIDDDHAALCMRIGRLRTGMAWAETPPSATRRLVGNVMIDGCGDGVLSVISTLFLAKVRREERVLFTAQRRDRLSEGGDGGWRLLERYVVLDDVVLPSENLSLIF